MPKQVVNFLWLNLQWPAPADPKEGFIHAPMPEKYIENVREAGRRHEAAEIMLWVDSERLTKNQWIYLEREVESKNVHLMDLRTIPEYRDQPVYSQTTDASDWRNSGDKDTPIWCQVDAAKSLLSVISLQRGFDQIFVADLDHAYVNIDAPEIQGVIKQHGLIVGRSTTDDWSIENQFWGFNRSRAEFFERFYPISLECAKNGRNSWHDWVDNIKYYIEVPYRDWMRMQDEMRRNKSLERHLIGADDVCRLFPGDGSRAVQPGSPWTDGDGESAEPLLIAFNREATRTSAINNAKSEKRPASSSPQKPQTSPAC